MSTWASGKRAYKLESGEGRLSEVAGAYAAQKIGTTAPVVTVRYGMTRQPASGIKVMARRTDEAEKFRAMDNPLQSCICRTFGENQSIFASGAWPA